ncbi:MAG: D-alanyl-D-alanine carboxypeptidase family protein, partial [Rhizobiaceae bacterium]
ARSQPLGMIEELRMPMKPANSLRTRLLRLSILPAAILVLGGASLQTPALVVDVATGRVLHDEAGGQPWFPASTTKLMTALLAFEALESGKVTMQTPVVLSKNALNQSFLVTNLKLGATMTLEDALYAAIAASANEIAVAIGETISGSEAAFVASMNDAAARLGMTATTFRNPSGLFDRKHQSTARDLALLGMEIAARYPQYERFFETGRVIVGGKQIDSNNVLLTRYPGTLGMKTGFVCSAGRNIVALAEHEGRRVMVVLLGATTERERNERAAKFFTEAFAGDLDTAGEPVSALRNDLDGKAPDMRKRLCTNDGASYEAERERLFPWGLPGQPSYLQPPGPLETRVIETWMTALVSKSDKVSNVPIPTPRPTQ